MKIRNSLDWFQLYYEEFEKEKMSKTTPKASTSKTTKVTVKQRVSDVIGKVRTKLSTVTSKIFHRKKAKKLTKDEKKTRREQQKRGILGIGLLFVVVSITYSSYVILQGVDSIASKIMLIPQVIFAVLTLIKAFSKIYK